MEAVPSNSTVVGVPGRVVKRNNISCPQDSMDQVHLPDPIKEDLQVLQRENSALVDHVLDLEKEMRKLRKELDKGESKLSEKPLTREMHLICTDEFCMLSEENAQENDEIEN